MHKVVNVELNSKGWVGEYVDNTKTHKYWVCPAIEKFLNEGWNIKDFKMQGSDVIFILEKSEERICNTY